MYSHTHTHTHTHTHAPFVYTLSPQSEESAQAAFLREELRKKEMVSDEHLCYMYMYMYNHIYKCTCTCTCIHVYMLVSSADVYSAGEESTESGEAAAGDGAGDTSS